MPTIQKVTRDGQSYWEVQYCGMTREFELAHEWDAHRFFEYVSECYSAAASSNSQASS